VRIRVDPGLNQEKKNAGKMGQASKVDPESNLLEMRRDHGKYAIDNELRNRRNS
jgi:hypothetical protein